MKNVKKIELHYMSEKLNASRNMLLDMWTSPVDQPVSYGMFGQTMDNAEVTHSLPKLTGFSPTYPEAQQQILFFIYSKKLF